jgi:transposase
MPAKYARAYSKGQKNDFRDAEAIAEVVQRPTMKFVATKTPDQVDWHALHRARERLVRQRTGIINASRSWPMSITAGADLAQWLQKAQSVVAIIGLPILALTLLMIWRQAQYAHHAAMSVFL